MLRDKLAIGALLLLFSFSLVQAGEAWLHVRVVEGGEHGEKVSVNLPLDLVKTVIEAVEHEHLHHGMVKVDHTEVDAELLRAILEAATESKDGTFVTVESEHENVKVMKKNKELQIHIDDHGEKVRVRVPISVCEALLEGDEDELNVGRALEILAKEKKGENLVTVEGDDEQIRVWIDDSMEGI